MSFLNKHAVCPEVTPEVHNPGLYINEKNDKNDHKTLLKNCLISGYVLIAPDLNRW